MANFNEMMEQYMEMYFAKMMEAKMNEMFSSMMPQEPQVAKAEVVSEKKPIGSQPLSREEWLERHSEVKETKKVKEIDLSVLNFVGFEGSSTKVYFNIESIPSDVWAINYETVKRYNGKFKKTTAGKYFYFSNAEDCKRFMAHAPIITELTVEDYDKIIEVKKSKLDSLGTYDRAKAEKVIEKWTERRNALANK